MEWYYSEDKQQKGPVTEEKFAELVRNGVIRADTLVWRQGMDAWQPYSKVFSASQTTAPAITPTTSSAVPAPAASPAQFPGMSFSGSDAQRERALSMVKGPAISLMIYAFITVGVALLGLLGSFNQQNYAEIPGIDPKMAEMMERFEGPINLISSFIILVVAAAIIYGAWRMKELKSYGLAITASILAFLPCSCPCCFLGMAFGVWALVVLNNADVKAQFN
jgi:hypothetical protein